MDRAELQIQRRSNSRKSLKLPYNMDGIVINVPALLAGAPADVYLSEFVSMAVETSSGTEEEIITDEFSLGDI